MERLSPELPPEVITEILSRLPVKPILQFRCVSKPWRSLIDSPNFIKMHLNRSIQSRSNLSLILYDFNAPIPNQLCSVDFDKLDIAFKLNPPLTFEKRLDKVWNSCNGLLCLSFGEGQAILWNPSTRKHLELPVSLTETPVDFRGVLVNLFGLGYDSVSDDYKVMRIARIKDYRLVSDDYKVMRIARINDYRFVHYEVRVYSLKSNSWRKVGDFPHHLELNLCTGLLVGGALHWSVNPKPMLREDGPHALIAFDLGVEEYRMVSLPECGAVDFCLKFAVLNGCLCVLHYYLKKGVDLWVMKEYGVKESWTKLIYIEQSNIRFAIYLEPLAYSKNGKKVLFQHNFRTFRWYDLEKKTIEMVGINGEPDHFGTTVCLGSLVPLDGGCPDDSKDQATKDKKKEKVIRSYDFLSKEVQAAAVSHC